jgi:hypothetical protein
MDGNEPEMAEGYPRQAEARRSTLKTVLKNRFYRTNSLGFV